MQSEPKAFWEKEAHPPKQPAIDQPTQDKPKSTPVTRPLNFTESILAGLEGDESDPKPGAGLTSDQPEKLSPLQQYQLKKRKEEEYDAQIATAQKAAAAARPFFADILEDATQSERVKAFIQSEIKPLWDERVLKAQSPSERATQVTYVTVHFFEQLIARDLVDEFLQKGGSSFDGLQAKLNEYSRMVKTKLMLSQYIDRSKKERE